MGFGVVPILRPNMAALMVAASRMGWSFGCMANGMLNLSISGWTPNI